VAIRISINTLSKIISLLAISTTVLISIPAHAANKTKTVVTTGVAKAGQPVSLRNAIKDAMQNAVEQAMRTIVNFELQIQEFYESCENLHSFHLVRIKTIWLLLSQLRRVLMLEYLVW